MLDRFTAGLLSGTFGGILMNIWSFISYHPLNFEEHRFVDWTGVMLYGQLPKTFLEVTVALLIHLLFVGFLGGIFALILPLLGSENYLLKGTTYAVFLGFIFFAIPTLFREPTFVKTPVDTVISNLIGASIYGLTLAQTLHMIDNRIKLRR